MFLALNTLYFLDNCRNIIFYLIRAFSYIALFFFKYQSIDTINAHFSFLQGTWKWQNQFIKKILGHLENATRMNRLNKCGSEILIVVSLIFTS